MPNRCRTCGIQSGCDHTPEERRSPITREFDEDELAVGRVPTRPNPPVMAKRIVLRASGRDLVELFDTIARILASDQDLVITVESSEPPDLSIPQTTR